MTSADLASSIVQDAVARVAGRIEIREIHLRYTTAVVGAPSVSELPRNWVAEVQTQHEARALLEGVAHDAPVAADLREFVVSVTFRIEYWAPDRGAPAEEDLPDVGLFAVFELVYDLDTAEGLLYGELQAFASVNAVFNAWPYWRELVDSTTRRMGFATPLVVGVLTANALLTGD